MTNQTTTNPTFEEAPASWNTRYITPDGFTCQITLRSETGSEVLARAQAAITWLQENGCNPYGNGAYSSSNGKSHQSPNLLDGRSDPAWCSIHSVTMKRREKDGQVWYSHKAPDGSWCKGKPKNGK